MARPTSGCKSERPGSRRFRVRLPSRNETESWRIPKAKARILMWIQPRQSVGMSDRVRGALAGLPPGCSLGIDVDGKAVARINYDTPVGGVNQAVPNPLWSGWASKELHAADAPYDRDMTSQAMFYIGRESMAHDSITSCRSGLMYRPDRQEKKRPVPAGRPPEQTSATPSRVAPGVANPFGLHPGKQVPPTPKELAHILSELPKEFTKGLSASDDSASWIWTRGFLRSSSTTDRPTFGYRSRRPGNRPFPIACRRAMPANPGRFPPARPIS